MISFRDQDRGSFVVCNGCLCLCFVPADDPVTIAMDSGFIDKGIIFLDTKYSVKTVDDLDICIAEIFIIPIDETEIPAGNGIIADAITGEDVYLHTIVCHKEMAATAADTVPGVVKQVINVESEEVIWIKIIVKKVLFQVDRSLDVHAIIAEIYKSDPFGKGERSGISAIVL